MILTSNQEKERRESICTKCPSKKDNKCGECGCVLKRLYTFKLATCRLKKW
ncbi:hypothetical protein CRP143_gp43 [Roseobacter phage CRP-143]|nr:hypothetical protein CRP143_gp43 [Roseobacter phage CRP-143]